MEIVINFLLGLSASLIAAMFLMYIVFYIWKPKIEISKFIVKTKTSNEEYLYKIKLINKSKFSANDIKVELWEKTEYKATSNAKAYNESVKKLKISTSEWLTIPNYISDKEISKTNFAPHCVTVKIIGGNPDMILDPNNNTSFVFKISAKHGLSNISKTFSMQFNDINCIKNGRFVFGNSLEAEEI